MANLSDTEAVYDRYPALHTNVMYASVADVIIKLEAEIARVEADAMALRRALNGTTRMLAERSDNHSRAWIWARNVVDANQRVLTNHPGAALLVELDAARAVVAQVRWAVENHYAPPPMYDALALYDEATKARGE